MSIYVYIRDKSRFYCFYMIFSSFGLFLWLSFFSFLLLFFVFVIHVISSIIIVIIIMMRIMIDFIFQLCIKPIALGSRGFQSRWCHFSSSVRTRLATSSACCLFISDLYFFLLLCLSLSKKNLYLFVLLFVVLAKKFLHASCISDFALFIEIVAFIILALRYLFCFCFLRNQFLRIFLFL